MKRKVLLTRAFQDKPIQELESKFNLEIGSYERNLTKDEIIEKIKDKEGIITLLADPIDKEVIDSGKNLKIIANYAVGYNNIDVEYSLRKGIYITHTPDVLTEATADIAFTLLLTVARRIIEANRFTVEGKFKGWEPNLMLGVEISGKKLGIIGMGRIGKAFARRAKGFGLDIYYYSRNRIPMEEEKKYGANYLELDELLKLSDFISIHTPLTKETHHLLNKEKLDMLKKTAILINTGRGPIVDEEYLIKILRENRIFGAGFDVFEKEPFIPEELKQLDNVVILPHIGSATIETRERMAYMCINSINDYFSGKTPENLIPEWKNKLESDG
jgi:glyoxylate reductase